MEGFVTITAFRRRRPHVDPTVDGPSLLPLTSRGETPHGGRWDSAPDPSLIRPKVGTSRRVRDDVESWRRDRVSVEKRSGRSFPVLLLVDVGLGPGIDIELPEPAYLLCRGPKRGHSFVCYRRPRASWVDPAGAPRAMAGSGPGGRREQRGIGSGVVELQFVRQEPEDVFPVLEPPLVRVREKHGRTSRAPAAADTGPEAVARAGGGGESVRSGPAAAAVKAKARTGGPSASVAMTKAKAGHAEGPLHRDNDRHPRRRFEVPGHRLQVGGLFCF